MTVSPEQRLRRIEASILPPPSAASPSEIQSLPVPNVVDFVVSAHYLNRPMLYPRQALYLKLIFLQLDQLTDYDYSVLRKWGLWSDHALEENRAYGIPSDLLDRIKMLKELGRLWFREVLAVIGRRGSKGYMGAISTSYIVYQLLALGDPQAYLGLPKGKVITIPVFAGNFMQARDVLWSDVADMIENAPCFNPFIARRSSSRLTLYSPWQLAIPEAKRGAPAIEIVARESTESAARGFASPLLLYDEVAHVDSNGTSSAERIYVSSTPAQATFPREAFSYLPSSPRHKTGQYYELYEQSLAMGPDGVAANPEMFPIQLPSWDLYLDWEDAHLIPMYPGGDTFARMESAHVTEDSPDLQRIKRTNPEMFRVEFQSLWAEVQGQFLDPEMVNRMFEPFDGRTLEMVEVGSRTRKYVIHVDLSMVGDNTAMVIGHTERTSDPMRPQVIIDLIRVWRPGDFEGRRIDYSAVEAEVRRHIDAFAPHQVTFDSWQSMAMIQNLTEHARKRGLRTHVRELKTTNRDNRERAEAFKGALYDNRVHAPFHELTRDELLFLQDLGSKVDHPTSGPVTTNDVAVCLFAVVAELLELARDPGRLFSAVQLTGMGPPANPADEAVFDLFRQFDRRLGRRGA